MPAELIARHCNALLAELDRIALDEDARAVRLAQLFAAVERAHESSTNESRTNEPRTNESRTNEPHTHGSRTQESASA